MVRGKVTESRLFSQFRAHYRCQSRCCNPYSGNEKGSVENTVGFLRRNLLVPEPSAPSLAALNRALRDGCDRINASARCRSGAPTAEALREDLAAMPALPGVPFDAVRWVSVRADKRGYVEAAGNRYCAGPSWHSRDLLVGLRAGSVEILVDRGRRVAVLPRAGRRRDGAQPAVARAGARRQAEGVRRVDDTTRHARRTRRRPRPVRQGGAQAGAEGDLESRGVLGLRRGVEAAALVFAAGRVPDDASVDVLARRAAAGRRVAAGGPDLAAYDGFLGKGASADAR